MKKEGKNINISSRWFSYAYDDLKLAKLALKEDIPHFACFHAQQAAEKALKC